METKDTDLIQQIRQLKNYIILDRNDYEKLVQNSKLSKNDNSLSVIEELKARNELLEKEITRYLDWIDYWKNKYETCLDELKKRSTKWWNF